MTDLLHFSFPLISQIIFLSHARLYCSEENLLRGFPCRDGNKWSFEFHYCIQLWFFSSNPIVAFLILFCYHILHSQHKVIFISDLMPWDHFYFSTESIETVQQTNSTDRDVASPGALCFHGKIFWTFPVSGKYSRAGEKSGGKIESFCSVADVIRHSRRRSCITNWMLSLSLPEKIHRWTITIVDAQN